MLEKYEVVIFDLDNTLIDNDKSMHYAFLDMVNSLNIKYTDKLFEIFKQFENNYWSSFIKGDIKIPDCYNTDDKRIEYLRINRFQHFFKNVNYIEANEINKRYSYNLGENIVPIDSDTYSVIKNIHKNSSIFIVTDNPKKPAIRKIEKLGIKKYIDDIVVADDCGYSKPSRQIFNLLLSKIKQKDKTKMIIIGDSLISDIQFGINNGIDSCLFNPNSNKNTTNIFPTYEIKRLKSLIKK